MQPNIRLVKQHEAVRRLSVASSSARLLIIAFEIARHAKMHNKSYIRLVNAHAKRIGRGNHGNFSAQKLALDSAARHSIQTRMICRRGNLIIAEILCQFLGFFACQTVNNAALAGMFLHESQQLFLSVIRSAHLIIQIGSVKARNQPLRLVQMQRLNDILPHLRRCCRRKRRNHRPFRQAFQKLRNASIAGAKIMSPLGNTVRLIYRDHRNF